MKQLKLQQTADKVSKLLISFPHLKDDDNRLIATFWYREFGIKDASAEAFLKQLAEGKLTSAETIRRSRQKLQEEFPALRGIKYNERHEAEIKVRDEIRYFNSRDD